jgi:tetratricopeptide (TPR) repeat protein
VTLTSRTSRACVAALLAISPLLLVRPALAQEPPAQPPVAQPPTTRPATTQGLPLKRPTLTPITITCPVFPVATEPIQQLIDESNRLATLGQESALEGDHRAARDLFAQAAQLNPPDPTLAYRLGREYEETGQRADALRQYCRYLALAPTGPDAPQVTGRAAQLVPEAALAHGTELVEQFNTGVAHFDTRDWSTAVQSFGQVAAGAPALPAAIFDRGLSYDRQGDKAAAIRDYSRYLALVPQAEDADSVRARMQTLREGIPSPGAAFALGLLPGGGQFYTGQPLLGAAVIAATAGGVVLALQTKTVTLDTTYQGPFGGSYPGTYQQIQHPNLALGVGVAAGVTLLGAVQAALVASARGAGLSAAADSVGATRSSFLPHAGPVTVELPTVIQSSDGLRLAFPIRITVQ